jgi:hypothetical protein
MLRGAHNPDRGLREASGGRLSAVRGRR